MITLPAQSSAITKPATKPFEMVLGQNDRMSGSVPVKNHSFAENIADLDKDPFGFGDIIDMINPLQHIPIVNKLYQSATGDTIGAVAMIVGGAIFGGPLGALTSAGIVAYRAARQEGETPAPQFEGTTIALADLRQGVKPYNT